MELILAILQEFQTELAKQLSVGDHRILSFQSSVGSLRVKESHFPAISKHTAAQKDIFGNKKRFQQLNAVNMQVASAEA